MMAMLHKLSLILSEAKPTKILYKDKTKTTITIKKKRIVTICSVYNSNNNNVTNNERYSFVRLNLSHTMETDTKPTTERRNYYIIP